MPITFGGLATGMDTESIVTELMSLERRPIVRMEADKTWMTNRLSAYTAFDAMLNSFRSGINNLDSEDILETKQVAVSDESFFAVTAGSDAMAGANYQVEVLSVAQVQKSVSQGYADKAASSFGSGEMTLTIGTDSITTIAINDSNNSLEGIMEAINEADVGVNASIINDGTDSPYRLVLTGENVASSFSLTSTLPTYNGDISSQLMAGGYANETTAYFGSGTLDLSTGHQITLSNTSNSLTDMMEAVNAETGTTGVTASIVADGDNFVLALSGGATITATDLTGGRNDALHVTETQAAAQAHIKVDNIDIYSDTNTLSEAIPGLSIDLFQAEIGTTTSINVTEDTEPIKAGIQSFVAGYNSVISYVSSQSKIGDSEGGILGGDAGLNAVKRRLQDLLTTVVDNSGTFMSLSQLGMETQKDGTLSLNNVTLTKAIQDNQEDVAKLLAGENGEDGIAGKFKSYLSDITDSRNGLLAGRKDNIDANIERIDSRIEQAELRLVTKEKAMRLKFSAMEELVSGMNNQSSFLTQQMDMLTNMMTRN